MTMFAKNYLITPNDVAGFQNILYYLITPRVVVEKATEIFYGNMKVLLFEDE
jgi:hypothetical protein